MPTDIICDICGKILGTTSGRYLGGSVCTNHYPWDVKARYNSPETLKETLYRYENNIAELTQMVVAQQPIPGEVTSSQLGKWESMEGYFNSEDYQLFKSFGLEKPVILEVGTYLGKGTRALRELYPDSIISTIDPVDYAAKSLPLLNCVFIQSTGQALDWEKPIDLLFIDDSDFLDSDPNNLDKFYPFLTVGGYAVLRDYKNDPDAVIRFQKRYELNNDALLWKQKCEKLVEEKPQ